MLLLSSSSKTVTYLTPFKHPSSLSTVNILLLDFYLVSLTSSLNRFLIKFSELDQKSEILVFYGIPVCPRFDKENPVDLWKADFENGDRDTEAPIVNQYAKQDKKNYRTFSGIAKFCEENSYLSKLFRYVIDIS